jgi:hypothetical protein
MSPTQVGTSTYDIGNSIIDLIYGTPWVTNAVTKPSFLALYDGAWDIDHCSLYADVNTPAVFGYSSTNKLPTPEQNVVSTNRKSVWWFLTWLESSDLIPTILSQLQAPAKQNPWNEPTYQTFDKLNNKFTKQLLDAEKKEQARPNRPWSPHSTKHSSWTHTGRKLCLPKITALQSAPTPKTLGGNLDIEYTWACQPYHPEVNFVKQNKPYMNNDVT